MTPATLDQPMEALKEANKKRRARADLRRQVFRGEVKAADLIVNPPDALDSNRRENRVTVAEILSWQRRWGAHRVAYSLRSLDLAFEVGPYTTPFDLSTARREQIVEALG